MRKVILPLLFILLFVFESTFVQMVPPKEFFGGERFLIPHFLMIAILFLTIYGSAKYGILYGVIFGLLFDIVYIEVIGIYLFLFPVIAYIVSQVMRVLQNNMVVTSLVVLFGVAVLESGSYGMNLIIGRTEMTFADFSFIRLIPTLIINLVFIILAVYPLKRHFEKFIESLSE
ncbi:rod shape-determining protein MreD [Cytobacillus purgationiresistens]|uniref:Rod shape-determining protein MreD n=1 Tax=Cytobacillus purgationiresistens TaxID=863449 RepID=A0ABU0AF73_9BACI|nr:rod shape-determining protein MreD [Cytobacillus purgationiresistens]MDQ0269908.1 rod shape-determining protein MreD [Cytobacillus purgationiresistens]